ncbi:MAG: peptidase [Gammaproteobacteria bacterium]|nr:peptidase [Gammaproteobacteria bacterium]|tara:strand:+ start:22608 stop:24959 length:2352 start_codon:yes stop_codon:yes gene_type:complete
MSIILNNIYLKISLFFLSLIFLIISSISLYISEKLPEAQEIREIELQIPLKIFTSDNKLIGEFGEKRRSAVSFEDIPPYFIKAVLAAEDDNFFNHSGVSYSGLLRSLYRILISGEIQGGGSTITMQVAGNYLTGRDVSLFRKIKDIFLAYRLESIYSKEEIFEFYVNRIFLGNRAYGIASASEVYYGSKIKDLNIAQWAMIAGLPKAPSAMNPLVNPRRALIRRNWILSRMYDLDYIYKEQFDLAIKAPVSASYFGLASQVDAPYLSETIRRFMINEYGLDAYKDGLEVYTTLDSKLQNHAVSALKLGLESYDKRHGFRQPLNLIGLFPENFFFQDLSLRLSLIESSNELPVGLSEVPEDQPLELIYEYLNDLVTSDNKFPVLVISVVDQLIALSGDRKIYSLDWPSSLGWARPYINEDQRGPKPKKYSDILKEGDLVWLERDKVNSSLSLTQIPEVQGSIVSIDPNNGGVKALVGGYDFFLSKYDRATQSFPLLGSNFKPFLYATALESGFNASTLINDAPIVFEDKALEDKWRPRNSSGRFYGPTRLREALVQSRNLVSIRLLREVGIDKVRNYSKNFGFQPESLPSDLSLALGTASLSPLKNAAAFSVFANGGKLVEPYFISKIIDRSGEIIFERKEIIPKQTVDPRVAFVIKDILQESAYRGTAKKLSELNRTDFAGKTGTTNEAESTWFTGFNDFLVTSVWVGFDQPKSLGNREFGSTAALPIWLDFMKPLIETLPKNTSLPPPGLVSIKVDKKTGRRSEGTSSSSIFEYFLEESQPD